MAQEQENRITIFTKTSASKYGGRALVLDLNRSVNHNYNTTVAKHAIEGAGYSSSDHAYQQNIIISVSGHISNAVVPPVGVEVNNFDPYGVFRKDDAYRKELDVKNEELLKLHGTILTINPSTGITAEQADAANTTLTVTLYNPGDLIPQEALNELTSDLLRRMNEVNTRADARDVTTENKDEVTNKKNLSPLYTGDQMFKQLDAFELLEEVYRGRLLLDVLTPNRLYENMVMTRLALPRESDAGQALEIRATFEQQSFVHASLSKTSIRKADVTSTKNNGRLNKTKKAISELSPRAREFAERSFEVMKLAAENQ